MIRSPLGEGWTLVSDPAAAGDGLIHLEGPYGIRLTLPLDEHRAALKALGLKPAAASRRSGPAPKVTPAAIAGAIANRRSQVSLPTADEVGGDLGYAERKGLERQLPIDPMTGKRVTFTAFRALVLRALDELEMGRVSEANPFDV